MAENSRVTADRLSDARLREIRERHTDAWPEHDTLTSIRALVAFQEHAASDIDALLAEVERFRSPEVRELAASLRRLAKLTASDYWAQAADLLDGPEGRTT